jgi:hypothetical protein
LPSHLGFGIALADLSPPVSVDGEVGCNLKQESARITDCFGLRVLRQP